MSDQIEIISHDCVGVEAIMAQTRHSFAKHTHEAFGIGYMHSGAQKSASGRGMVEAGAGNIITVNPREVHDGHPIGDDPRGWNMLYFEPTLIADLASDMANGAHTHYEFTNPVIDSPPVRSCFITLFDAIAKGNEHAARLRREEMLFLLLHHTQINAGAGAHGSNPDTGKSVAHARIKRAKSLIDDCPSIAHGLRDLAAVTGLSRFQTLRDFTRATGLTPHAYLIQRRIDLARAMIKGGARLADIAQDAGFSDQSHLNRHFVRAFGITPGRYAKAIRAC
ncbi:MAG: AraC family transcriptional regulator [Thalassospira sp.]|uniref:AraC family transcriptional regulator n=1 Tax=Thalassospira sp. TaxID=1912094 RepID=UPI0032EB885F